MKRKNESRNTSHSAGRLTAESRIRAGSALILVVVLTSLLAIVGVMFVMVARVDRIATSAISENKTLDSAVEAVIARISQELVLDVPGVAAQEYYDYPDAKNAWLASLEPYDDGGYKWRWISDVYNKLGLSLELDAEIIPDYQKPSDVGDSNSVTDYPADADGDGVADSKWIELEGINSGKGKPIYASIRVIDNGGMLNVNTAYKFDPTGDRERIDGSSQMQINLMALASLPGEPPPTSDHERDLLEARANYGIGGVDPFDLYKYEENVVWRYNEPNGSYTPFDISDELELRYRFLVNQEDIDTRLEELGPIGRRWGFREYAFRTPAGTGDLGEWFISAYGDGSLDPNYAYRHIGTIYNMDRIINPYGGRMVNVNRDNTGLIYSAIKLALFTADPNFKDIDEIAAQTAVNLIDFRDNDSDVTPLPDVNGITYYGFEAQPFISEIGIKIDAVDPNKSSDYAVELYNPFNIPIPLDDFTLSISNQAGADIASVSLGPETIGANGYYVIANNLGSFTIDVNATTSSNASLILSGNYIPNPGPPPPAFWWDHYNITLKRTVNATDIYLDSQSTQAGWFNPGTEKYLARDDDNWHIVYQTMNDTGAPGSLGSNNSSPIAGNNYNLALANANFVSIGDVVRPLKIGPSNDPNDMLGQQLTSATSEADIRLDLTDPNFQKVFNYLTVWPPSVYVSDPNETRIKGRININTAPWYVISQLPWVSDTLAQAIVAYRDKLDMDPNGPDYYHSDANDSREQETGIEGLREELGFASVGELNFVIGASDDDYSIHYYELDSNDLAGFPDLTPSDKAPDDFEERDVIFARLSNLVTVRSDVFTAYILVRIGADGPQKRVMAILDRSNVYSDDGRVQIVALHPVADPR